MLRANAVYEGRYLLGTSIARPLIAKRLVEIAKNLTLIQYHMVLLVKVMTKLGLSFPHML